MPITNLPNFISNMKDFLKVWRKTQNGGIAIREINHYLGLSGHIKLEFGFVKSVDKDDFDKHGAGYESDKFYQENDVKNTKSDCVSSEEKDSKTESARFFSEDEDVKLLSVASEYYKAFPEQAQSI